ncbi:hypothetical protein QTN47_25520 [Danxiaibacter flavus]|uniref:Uncharacterized protein n=1 Tax=Danxiaibacter flavus TaxID=3049108 RepID=A0ABV3ZLZ7_9BACT|nr:hypothetical protein QNM32_25525 [Chitinophagaceae bacterium DXS]
MLIPKTLSVTDDSGFLAIVNADKYKSFVDENWEYEQLIKHFVDQMNNNSLVIWATGSEGEWTMRFTDKQSDKQSFKEFSKSINITNGKLWLINYEDLTMVAQFEDEKIPLNHNKDLFIQLDNGIYNITIRQLFDPCRGEQFNDINFEVILQQADNVSDNQIDKIFWQTE